MRLAKRLAFLGFDFHIGIVKGEQPLTRCGRVESRGREGGVETPLLPLARAERKPFDRKKNLIRATSARTIFWFSFGTQKRTLALMEKRSKPAPPARELT